MGHGFAQSLWMHAVDMSDLGEQEAFTGDSPLLYPVALYPLPQGGTWDLNAGQSVAITGFCQLGSRAALNPATGAEVLLKDVWRAPSL